MLNRKFGYPLSPQQQRLWRLQYTNGNYCAQAVLGVEGPLDSVRLRSALQEIVARHEIFRTWFQVVEGESLPLQVVAEEAGLIWTEIDLVGSFEKTIDEQIAELLSQERNQPFADGTSALRATLVKRGHEKFVLLITASALCADLGTLRRIAEELARNYAGQSPNKTNEQEIIQYSQYAEWQRQMLESEYMEEACSYWRKQLEVEPEGLRLPFERQVKGAFSPEHVCIPLTSSLLAKADSLAQKKGTDLPAVLLACWQALLWRLIRQPHTVVATSFDGRESEELKNGLGLYAKYLPVRCDCSPETTFTELLSGVTRSMNGARAWQHYVPSGNSSRPDRDVDWPAFFTFVFEYLEPVGEEASGGVRFKWEEGGVRSERYKVKLEIGEREEGKWECVVRYDGSRMRREDVESVAEEYATLLGSALEEPEKRVRELEINSAQQWELLCARRWLGAGGTEKRSLVKLLEEQVERSPKAVAVVSGEERVSYEELNERGNRLGRRLRKLGVGPEVRVALCLERSVEMLVGIVGVLKAGGVYVPLDPEYPEERLGWMLEDTGAKVVVTSGKLAERVGKSGVEVEVIELDGRREQEELAGESGANLEGVEVEGRNAAYVIYTSGSTGRPKGVVVTHGNVVRLFSATEGWFRFSGRDVWSLFHSYAFDVSVWEMWGAWLYGGKLVVLKREETRSPEELYEVLEREGVTVLSQTPSAFRQLAQVVEGRERKRDLKVRAIAFAGEALNPGMVKGWAKKYPETELVNLYGITETTVHSTYKRVGWEEMEEEERSPIGEAFGDLRMYVLTEDLREAGTWETGEIYLGGAGVARGYLNRPELTAERFLPELEGTVQGGRMYRSGDLARRRPDGELEYVGRGDHQVKIRGFRVELGEVEAAVRKAAGVKEAAVLVKGEGNEKRLVCYVFAERAGEIEVEELRERLREKLPEYMVPGVFVVLEQMPLTVNGKLDKRALPEPGHERPRLKQQFVPPRNEAEKTITEIWCEVLKLDSVGIEDNFFEIGGHSLLLIEVSGKLKQRLGLEVPVVELFGNPTISALAQFLSHTQNGHLALGERAHQLEDHRAAARRQREGRAAARREMLSTQA